MVKSSVLGSALVAAATVSAFPGYDAEFEFSGLLKRQQPGTPSYNCHDNCGQVIIMNRELGEGICENDGFQSNYKNCLQCSGPDNYGIWSFYGNSVGAVGTKCGLSTTPLSGKQPDVGPAVQAGSGGGGPPSSTTTTAAPPTSTTTTTGGGPAPTTTTATTTGGGDDDDDDDEPTSTTSVPSPTGGAPSSSFSPSVSGAASTTTTTSHAAGGHATPAPGTTGGVGGGSGSGSGGHSNGTTTRPPPVVAGAAQNVAGVFGAVAALGAAWVAL